MKSPDDRSGVHGDASVTPRTVLVGVDGCRSGWLAVIDTGGELSASIFASVAELCARVPPGALIAIDIPIGLPAAHDRVCCKEARALLGRARRSSVFPAPVRGCMSASTAEEAVELQRAVDGRGMSKQLQGIWLKIREVDNHLRANPADASRLYEIHPEVSFALWAGQPMAHKKSRSAGRIQREQLIDGAWPGCHGRLWSTVCRHAERDDLNDAFAALWSARRIASGAARSFPEIPLKDAEGLPMRILG